MKLKDIRKKKKDEKVTMNAKIDPKEKDQEVSSNVEESVNEAEMTAAQKKKREEIVLKMKDKEDEFKKNYGDRWKEVMYATATKMAMKEEVIYEAKDKSTDRLKMLVRLGLMDKKDMTKIVRSISKMKEDKPVSPADRKILFDLLNELIGMVTGDEQMFQKAKKAVREAVDPSDTGGSEEISMAMRQLEAMDHFIDGIEDRLKSTGDMEEWYQNKLTKAHDYLKTLYSYGKGDGEKEMDEANGNEITVGNYTTKHFHMCGSAIKTMKKNSDVKNAEQMTRLQDQFYKMEKDVMNAGEATDEQKSMAQDLYNKIMGLAKSAGIEKEVGGYMKMHLDSVMKGKPKPGFGRVDVNEAKRTVTIDRPDSLASIRVMKPKDPSKFNQDKKYPPHLRGDSIGKARKAFKDMRRSSTGK